MIKICENCNEEWNAKRSSKRFCSGECYLEYRLLKDKRCLNPQCGTLFSPTDSRQQYCTRSCAATVNNTVYVKRPKGTNGRKCRKCPNRVPPKRAICDDCRVIPNRISSGEYIARWLDGQESGSGSNGTLKHFCRRYLLEQANYRCQSPTCAVPGGWSVPNPVTGKPILTVDHIDGNWKNNAVDNLLVLCYSCHTLTPTFGSLNKKSAGIRGSGNRAYKEYSMNRKAAEHAQVDEIG